MKLREMDEADEKVQKTAAAKNELEGFVYSSREKLRELLTGVEDWLYDAGADETDIEVFQKKMAELQEPMTPILARAWEHEQRPQLPESVEKLKTWLNSTMGYIVTNMTWVSERERQTVTNMSDAFDAWYANVTEE